ncbi:MBL fold metallo-hydrolase [Sphingomicrobium astaxanthinifaciens]|uniref:MBL fold metallo-hydrolase n=1 Tax=Sphingomicrobium astaxanthinifaciens TaxID=1227949 RepID=UPI001FCB23B0|nr:MBL fold metallo-hydrolase [Sphingomicrobium astaxanthinifaciens]MCJ7421936.1 MBL fold metallo-hydrolase [Sphingomicrobium astaxanthinifaciens]
MRHLAAGLLAATLMAPAAAAQDDTVTSQCLDERVCVLFGPGGNVALHRGADGLILIDDKYERTGEALLAAIAQLSEAPLSFVVNTHYHADHSGANERMRMAGGKVVAHRNAGRRIGEQVAAAAARGEASAEEWMRLPVLTFDSEIDFHLNGERIRVAHAHHAHTDGDSIVWFEDSRIVHMGDIYFKDVTWPYLDLAAGGSIDGVIAAVRGVLAQIDEDWTVIPGHGPVATHADLHAYHDMLVSIRNAVAAGIARGDDLAAIQASAPAAGYAVGEGFITADKFIEAVYKSLRGETDYSPR